MNVLICSIYLHMSSISDSRLRSCSNCLRISSISESRLRASVRSSSTSILRLCCACRPEKLTSISLDAGVSVGVQGLTLTPPQRPGVDANRTVVISIHTFNLNPTMRETKKQRKRKRVLTFAATDSPLAISRPTTLQKIDHSSTAFLRKRAAGDEQWERPITRYEAEEEEGDGVDRRHSAAWMTRGGIGEGGTGGRSFAACFHYKCEARAVACPKPLTALPATAFSTSSAALPACYRLRKFVRRGHCLPFRRCCPSLSPLLPFFARRRVEARGRRRRVEARGRKGFFFPSIGAREAKVEWGAQLKLHRWGASSHVREAADWEVLFMVVVCVFGCCYGREGRAQTGMWQGMGRVHQQKMRAARRLQATAAGEMEEDPLVAALPMHCLFPGSPHPPTSSYLCFFPHSFALFVFSQVSFAVCGFRVSDGCSFR
ncbi:hypothetical protein Taro_043947 [Colocasia esculenta]|uniref:Uncharacterized protein n=1 Tax=Colocasia esculenta TaxID=4460 RepID=A0A843WSP5_COLES|nr:hypothetical protein [Colocasia esculenta]